MFWKRAKVDVQPEWLIVGLGNPGSEYRGTRHNVGFEVLDELAIRHRIKLDKSKHRARIGLGKVGETAVCLVKPLTYMNLSGQAVAPVARDYSVPPERVLVIADEMDLPAGKLRLRESGSAGGHNGHKSLIQYLKSQDYPRIRIGIGRSAGAIDHVLGGFTPEEREGIDPAIEASVKAAAALIEDGPQAAQKVIEAYNKES